MSNIGTVSSVIMNGDIVLNSKGERCIVQIQGRPGTYCNIKGKTVNIATGNKGFLKNVETGKCTRTEWTSLRVVKRAHPEFIKSDVS